MTSGLTRLDTAGGGLMRNQGFRQFVKFCIVGATSFTIDFGGAWLLHYGAGLPVILAKTISFALAVTNGFIWNRLWTFRAVGHRPQHHQYAMFFGVNVVGYVLNVGIVMAVIRGATGRWSQPEVPKPVFIAANLTAVAVVVFWNFFANRHWTFRDPDA